MKKLLLILLCLPMIGFGQQTYVSGDIFENYGMGIGVPNDDGTVEKRIVIKQ